VAHLGPISLVILVIFLLMARVMFRRSFAVDHRRVAEVMELDEREALRDTGLLIRSLVILAIVTVAFLFHTALHYDASVIALLGGGMLVGLSRRPVGELTRDVEWETLLFFAGLFVMVGALVKVGAIDAVAEAAASISGGSTLVAAMLILVVSGALSGFVDNIPYVAAMAPVVAGLTGDLASGTVLWWALALGADLGGNATAVGASANVVVVGIAGRAGHPIRFLEFLKYGALVTVVSIAVSAVYLWLRYFVLA
jgi:Na+/H+ antiporter NhaD/arsenite permease-like protein